MDLNNGTLEWNDMYSQFEDAIPADSPFGGSNFHDFTNLDTYSDGLNLSLRSPPKPIADSTSSATTAHVVTSGAPLTQTTSAESSSQDSSSDSSSRRKRKTASESPAFYPPRNQDTATRRNVGTMAKREEDESKMAMIDIRSARSYEQNFAQPMHNLSLEKTISNPSSQISQFDFHSSASSPIQAGDFNNAMSLDAQVRMPAPAMMAHFQEAQMQTINPGMFVLGDSRDQSPATNNHRSNSGVFQTSPNAIFSTPSSDSPDTFGNNLAWNQTPVLGPHNAWPSGTDLANQQYHSSANMPYSPSPQTNGSTPSAPVAQGASGIPRASALSPQGLSPLHIAPISTKSRVETQINVNMTLELPPPGIERLHLPLHTIAKSKLLAKEDYDETKILELHTMLVCTSAMHNPQYKEKALRRAAAQNNAEIQRRAEQTRLCGDDERDDANKALDEAEKPANGGEVRICSNCIQRERKRAGRKKTKREEEQQHWERYETERVVVFNSNEHLPFKPCESGQIIPHEPGIYSEQDPYTPPDGALQVTAAMRIACYCRHQAEKEGFQVIFTMKDHLGNVVAQQLSDSILITDDHKTHPPGFGPLSTPVTGDIVYHQGGAFLPNGLPVSHSMVDMTAHAQPFTSSRSAGNLQALAYAPQYSPHSHVHQFPGSGYGSQMTSTAMTPATMTPTSMSRPASPSSAGQSGPNKKRKSASFHRKVPSGLTMTPRVDTNQPAAGSMSSASGASAGNSKFSPSSAVFPNQGSQANHSYMTIPNHGGPAQYFGSGPPTPIENSTFNFGAPNMDSSRFVSNQAYFSHPSSAVPSRASSPVLQQTRANMAAYARQPSTQAQQHSPSASSSSNARSSVYHGQAPANNPNIAGHDPGITGHYPNISRITPSEGPVSGGTEVAILGENFVLGIQVMFGEHTVPTHFLSPNSLLAQSPPGRAGTVHLTLVPPPGLGPYPFVQNKPTFKYTGSNEEMMVMALKFLSEQQQGTLDAWQTFAQQNAASYVQTRVSRGGMQQGYLGNQRLTSEVDLVEDLILNVFDAADLSSATKPNYDFSTGNGATMLMLACSLGMHRVAAALLARGATADVRDRAGYTPIMHAALHGRTQLFRLLLARGADPTMRSLTGYAALDLAPSEARDDLLQMVVSTRRRRHSGPSNHSRLSFGSTASSAVSWDIASASYYESEVGTASAYDSEISGSRPTSRRPSTHASLSDEPPIAGRSALQLRPSAGMIAWRNALAAQIQAFQASVQHNMTNFHLPPLPHLADYRCFSSLMSRKSGVQSKNLLVPETQNTVSDLEPASLATTAMPQDPLERPARQQRFWDVFSHQDAPPSAPAPPAYGDLFPDRKDSATVVPDYKTTSAVTDSAPPRNAPERSMDKSLQQDNNFNRIPDAMTNEKSTARAALNAIADARCVVVINHHPVKTIVNASASLFSKTSKLSDGSVKLLVMPEYVTIRFASWLLIPLLLVTITFATHLLLPTISATYAGVVDRIPFTFGEAIAAAVV